MFNERLKENKNRLLALAAAGSLAATLAACGEKDDTPEPTVDTSSTSEVQPSDNGGEEVTEVTPETPVSPDDLPEVEPVDETEAETEPADDEKIDGDEWGSDVQIDPDTGEPVVVNEGYPDGYDRSAFEPEYDISTPQGGTFNDEGKPSSLDWTSETSIYYLGLDPNYDVATEESVDGTILVGVTNEYPFDQYKSGIEPQLQSRYDALSLEDKIYLMSTTNPRHSSQLEKDIAYLEQNLQMTKEIYPDAELFFGTW